MSVQIYKPLAYASIFSQHCYKFMVVFVSVPVLSKVSIKVLDMLAVMVGMQIILIL